jgi:hypothetical protein
METGKGWCTWYANPEFVEKALRTLDNAGVDMSKVQVVVDTHVRSKYNIMVIYKNEVESDCGASKIRIIRAMAAMIKENELHKTNREDTVGILMRCGAFHYMAERDMCALARAIDKELE